MKKIILFLFFLTTPFAFSQIRINEICSSNNGNFFDEKFDTPDWIELYNYSDEPVNLSNWSISDQSDYSSAWQLPDTIIQPGGYFVVCASDRAVNNAKSSSIISNGVSNVLYNFEDQLSFINIKVEDDFIFEVDYNSFKCELNPHKKLSLGGILIKDKLAPKSRMIGFFNYPNEGRQVFVHSRDQEEVYRGVEHISDRIKLSENSYVVEKVRDSIYYRVIDEERNVILNKKYIIPFEDEAFLGFTILTHDIEDFDTLNINSMKLNGKELKVNEFETINFHGTNIYTSENEFCHTDFKLSSGGDSLFLFRNNFLNQSIKTIEISANKTFNVDDNDIMYFGNPTPGYENSEHYKDISRINKELLDVELINNFDLLDKIDDSYTYSREFETPNRNSNKLVEYTSDTSNFLIVKRFEDDKVDSEQFFLPLIKPNNVINNLIHFHLYTDTSYLYNDFTGIINQTFSFSKVKAYLAISKNNKLLFRDEIQLRKHGNFSNIWRKQTPFRLIFDSDFKVKEKESFFPYRGEINGSAFVLRNGGDDEKTMLRSRFSYHTLKSTNLLAKDYNTVILNLNNRFWGVYNLRERIDDDFLADYHNVSKSDIKSFENDLQLKYGSPVEMIEFNKSLIENKRNSYQSIDSILNIKNFIDYIFIHTFNIQHDWPHNNVVAYSYGEKWHYLATDMDYSYKYRGAGADIDFINNVFEKNENITTRILHNLLKSNKFVYEYINRSCDLMNTSFSSNYLVSGFDSLANYFSQFKDIQNQRWPNTLNNWEEDTDEVRTFLRDRASYYYTHLQTYFEKGPALLNLTSFPSNAGSFRVNTLTIEESQWSGKYLQNVPVTITALPKHGYKFKKWNIDSLGSSASITTTLSETMNIEAIYEERDPTAEKRNLVINEIMYNADKENDTKDWIELYNAGTESVNLIGWSMIDEDDTHTPFVISNDVIIEPNEYIIFTRNKTDFEALIDIENQVIGDFDYGFGGNDIVILKDAQGNTHDSVNYDNNLPWPEGADGTGYTIELINPFLDNNVASNWEISQPELGTPGLINSVYDDSISSISINADEAEVDFVDNQLFVFSKQPIESLKLFDVNGRNISIEYKISIYRAESDLNHISDGLYFVNIKYLNGNEETLKLIVD
ncbi:MAG: lamin tail domain-containing protein [Chlorobiota bacterium]